MHPNKREKEQLPYFFAGITVNFFLQRQAKAKAKTKRKTLPMAPPPATGDSDGDAPAAAAAAGAAGTPPAPAPSIAEDAVSLTDDCKDFRRDPFLAFVPQLARWGGGILRNEARTVANAVAGSPGFLKGFVVGSAAFYRANPRTLYKEVVSGFTVAVMQVPESIAFSFVAGVPPLSGLQVKSKCGHVFIIHIFVSVVITITFIFTNYCCRYDHGMQATWWMAFITGILGGKPGMISGAAGALAVVVTHLTSSQGDLAYLAVDERLNVLYMTMFVCGIFQILFAVFRLAQLVRLIPETGMIGFMNGEPPVPVVPLLCARSCRVPLAH